ncbi:MAG: hypothetical protein HOK61_12095 [Alphaproteobacteria bacterium]|jgi:hypothetical protein|nr:hypothetical protein [Alphaproteobacteria bacterium]
MPYLMVEITRQVPPTPKQKRHEMVIVFDANNRLIGAKLNTVNTVAQPLPQRIEIIKYNPTLQEIVPELIHSSTP